MKSGLLALVVAAVLTGCASQSGMTDPATNGTTLNEQGFELLKERRYTEAEPYFVKSLQQYPDNPYAHLNLGVVYQYTNRRDLAKQQYLKVIALDSKSAVMPVRTTDESSFSLADMARRNLQLLESQR